MKRTILTLLLAVPFVLAGACGTDETGSGPGPAQPDVPAESGAQPVDQSGDEPVDRVLVDADLADVERSLREGRKIEAIRRYREIRGVGLKDAKDAVDAMEAGLSKSR